MGFEIDVRTKTSAVAAGESEPFRIAVFGDFSGRDSRGLTGGAGSMRPIAIDRDNFDRVMAKLAPAITVTLEDGAPAMPVSFTSLDDFHPDSLFQRLPLFSQLRRLRDHASQPASAAVSTAPAPHPTGGGLLDEILGDQAAPERPRRGHRPGDLQAFIEHAAEGSLVPEKGPEQVELAARADAAIGEQMRALLHQREFQALESAWRSLFFLVRRLETGVDLQVCLFDVSKPELCDDLNGSADLRDAGFYRAVVTSGERGKGWALLVGCYSFGAGAEDVELLARIAMVARQGQAPFLGAAQPGIVGCDSLAGMPDPREWHPDPEAAQYWQILREVPEANFLGVAMPRFLLRLPYGAETSPIETFSFEEMPGGPVHEDYLWGYPAVAAACLLGQSFSADGWGMRPGTVREIAGLPLHVYRQDGESAAQPSAEAWLSDYAAEAVIRYGIMPLLSARDSERVLLMRFQSLANPPRALAGRW